MSFQSVNADMTSALYLFWSLCFVALALFGVGQIVNGFIDGERRQLGFGVLCFTVSGTLAILTAYQR